MTILRFHTPSLRFSIIMFDSEWAFDFSVAVILTVTEVDKLCALDHVWAFLTRYTCAPGLFYNYLKSDGDVQTDNNCHQVYKIKNIT